MWSGTSLRPTNSFSAAVSFKLWLAAGATGRGVFRGQLRHPVSRNLSIGPLIEVLNATGGTR